MTRRFLFVALAAGLTSCTSVGRQSNHAVHPPVAADAPVGLSAEAGAYIDSVVAVMRSDAVRRAEIDFDAVGDTIRAYAAGARTAGDTHAAIKRALPLLGDHHSSFWTADEVRDNFGFTAEDVAVLKAGQAPRIDPAKLDSLARSLDYASGRVVVGQDGARVGVLAVPEVDVLFEEGMALFADSLQSTIRALDRAGVVAWVVDLRENRGGNVVPMAVGLGPLLDAGNVYYVIDAGGVETRRSYYRGGGYYDIEAGGEEGDPLVQSSVAYRLTSTARPVAVLVGPKTASSAEAVTALFRGQPNVAVVGQSTSGLTSSNAFRFLSDDSVLNLTSGYLADRTRQTYRQGIDPDIEVPAVGEAAGDAELERALEWVAR